VVAGAARIPSTPPPPDASRAGRAFAAYIRWAAIAVVALYGFGYSTIGFGLLFFGALWSLAARRSWLWARTVLDGPLAVFAAVLVVSAAASPYRQVAPLVTVALLISGAVYFGGFTWLLSREPEARSMLLRVWAAASPVAACVGIAYSLAHDVHLNNGPVIPGRAEIPRGVGPNGLGTTMVLGSVLALGFAFRARGRTRIFWLVCSALSFVGLLVSGSRASLAGWILGAAYLVWRELRAHPGRATVILAAGLAALIVVGFAVPQVRERMRYTLSDVSGNRLQIWHTSLEMIAAHPLLGTGFGTFQVAYDARKAPGMSPEPFAFDMWLNLAVETGLLGLLAALWVAIAAAREWVRSARAGPVSGDPLRAVIGAAWLALLVDQLADNTLFSISTSGGLWLLLALVVAPAGISSTFASAVSEPAPGTERTRPR